MADRILPSRGSMEFGHRIGRRIRDLRVLAGLSQAQLAERLGKDVAVGTVSRWERGSKTPPIATLARIAEGLGTDLDGFFGGVVGATPVVGEGRDLARIRDVLAGLGPAQLRNVHALLRVYREGLDLAGDATDTKAFSDGGPGTASTTRS